MPLYIIQKIAQAIGVNVIRVNEDGDDTLAAQAGNYNWDYPFKDPFVAYTAAVSGDLIWVDPGTYSFYDSGSGLYNVVGQKDGIKWHVQDATIDWYYNAENRTGSEHSITGNGVFTKDEDDGFNTFRIRADGIKFNLEGRSVTNMSADGDAFSFATAGSADDPANPSVEIAVNLSEMVHSAPQYAVGITRKVKGYFNCPKISNDGIGSAIHVVQHRGTVIVNGDVECAESLGSFSGCITMANGNFDDGLIILNGNANYVGSSYNATNGAITVIDGHIVVNGNISSTSHHGVLTSNTGNSSIKVYGDISSETREATLLSNPNCSFEHHGNTTVETAIAAQGAAIKASAGNKVFIDGIVKNNGSAAGDHGILFTAALTPDIEFGNIDFELASTTANTISDAFSNTLVSVYGIVKSQSHTVTAGEESSGIIAGLENILNLKKVETTDGTAIQFTRTTSNSITVTPPDAIIETQNLVIWSE